MPSNSCGHLLLKLGISYQTPTVHWWLKRGPQRAVLIKMTDELDGADTMWVHRNKSRLGVHRNVPYEFVITLFCWDVVDTCFAQPVENM